MRHSLGTLALLFLSGCTSAQPMTTSSGPLAAVDGTTLRVDTRSLALQAAKARLTDSLLAIIPGERGEFLRAQLDLPGVGDIRVGNSPSGQALVDHILAIRDSLRTLPVPHLNVRVVTLVMPDTWTYGDNATAVVNRKAARIVFAPNATAGTFAQAVRTYLSADSTQSADVVVTRSDLPASWRGNERVAMARRVLETLRATSGEQIALAQ